MNYTAPLCFGTRDDQFGKFSSPYSGKLASVKLVHLYGNVTCKKEYPSIGLIGVAVNTTLLILALS